MARRRMSDGPLAATLPEFVGPQLATLVERPPTGEGWLHEIKYDGYRVLARLEDGDVRLLTRSGQDWTERFSGLAAAVARLPAASALLDGEAVILDDAGRSDFQALQNALSASGGPTPAYIVFDLLFLEGKDMRPEPLAARKAALERLLDGGRAPLVLSPHQAGDGPAALERACAQGLEGIISKRADAPYASRRTDSWRKAKCRLRQEAVIGGFTRLKGGLGAGSNTRSGLGALLVGVWDQGRLRYLGRVGTGFDDAGRAALTDTLAGSATGQNPFGSLPAAARRGVTFVRPRLVAEVEYRGVTADGLLRQAAFKGLRQDKTAAEVVGEGLPPAVQPADAPARANGSATRRRTDIPPSGNTGLRVTHPDKLLWPKDGITKADLLGYYRAVAGRMLPHLARRPLTLLRCPDGLDGECFHQRHPMAGMGPAVRGVEATLGDTPRTFLAIDDLRGLLALAQFGCLEFHPWNATDADLERPDRLVFDLDPGPGVPWKAVAAAALELKAALDARGLASFPKTSGGKGYHLVVPILPTAGWREARAFSKAVSQSLVERHPDRYVITIAKAARPKKILIDYLRNAPGATSAAPYSTRARPGAPVSAPVSWAEVEAGITAAAVTLRSVPQRLQAADPWADFFDVQQRLPG